MTTQSSIFITDADREVVQVTADYLTKRWLHDHGLATYLGPPLPTHSVQQGVIFSARKFAPGRTVFGRVIQGIPDVDQRGNDGVEGQPVNGASWQPCQPRLQVAPRVGRQSSFLVKIALSSYNPQSLTANLN